MLKVANQMAGIEGSQSERRKANAKSYSNIDIDISSSHFLYSTFYLSSLNIVISYILYFIFASEQSGVCEKCNISEQFNVRQKRNVSEKFNVSGKYSTSMKSNLREKSNINEKSSMNNPTCVRNAT